MKIEQLKIIQNYLYCFIEDLRLDLFPNNFEIVPREILFKQISNLTKKINQNFDIYHELSSFEEKIELKPVLIFMQQILEHMTRLIVFEQKHLTHYNQILLDLNEKLKNYKHIIETSCYKQAERELNLINDSKLKQILTNNLKNLYLS